MLLTTLRPAGTFTVRLSPAIIVPCSAAAQFSTSVRPSKTQRTHFSQTGLRVTFPYLNSKLIRCASTASSAPTNSANPTPKPRETLTWNRFLALRRTKRKISVVASSISSIASAYAGLRVFIGGGYDSTLSASLGLDPLLTTGFSTMAFLAVGWLIGPIFGTVAFNMRYASLRKDIEDKDRAFYARIKRHRVDPSSSSIQNPVPDFYGEKIGSVAEYRRWLKDQRAFNLKRGAYQGNKVPVPGRISIDIRDLGTYPEWLIVEKTKWQWKAERDAERARQRKLKMKKPR